MQLDDFLKQDWTHIDLSACNLYVILDDVGAIRYLQKYLPGEELDTDKNLNKILEENGVKVEFIDHKDCIKISPTRYYEIIENYNIRIDTFFISKFYDAPTFLLRFF